MSPTHPVSAGRASVGKEDSKLYRGVLIAHKLEAPVCKFTQVTFVCKFTQATCTLLYKLTCDGHGALSLAL